MSDGDEVGQEVAQHARVALTIALQMGEKFARMREEMARDAKARSAAQARELSVRFDAERGAARASLQVVDRPEWWERASVQDIARVAETAEAWKSQELAAVHAADVVQREVAERYGVNMSELRDIAPERARAGEDLTEAQLLIAGADRLDRANEIRADNVPTEVFGDVDDGRARMAAELEARANDYDLDADQGGTPTSTPDQLRELAADARAQAQLFRDDAPTNLENETSPSGSVTTSTAPADSHATAAREAGSAKYDSAERRQDMIASMEAKGVPAHLIEVRMSADAAHAAPAAAAVNGSKAVSTVQQTRRGRGQGQGVERGDIGR